jgi:hypothetical protein
MKGRRCYLFALLLFSPAVSQQQLQAPHGTISGVVVQPNGEPARSLRLTARISFPTGGRSGDFPHARTNDLGEYRFQKLPLSGAYLIYADDEAAGYSLTSTGPSDSHTDVEIAPEYPDATFNLYLPSRAGFIQIHLTNRRTGRAIRKMMTVWASPADKPGPLGSFTISCYPDHVILVPPDQNMLLHVKADGFSEWDESVGTGRPVSAASGSRLTLDVQLDPAE